MRVFYELTHTPCDREVMRSPDISWDIYHPGGWDHGDRPFPENARLVSRPEGKYDAAVAGTEKFLDLVPEGVPIAFSCRIDFGSWPKNTRLLSRVSAWVAINQETVVYWKMLDEPKATVIEQGIDSEVFKGYTGDVQEVITAGNLLPSRPEKAPEKIIEVSKRIPVYVYGYKNDGLPNTRGFLPMQRLAEAYRRSAVYFNPSGITCCSVLEAMATGMPVVTMGPVKSFIDLMRHNENCIIASDVDDAVWWIDFLLRNRSERMRIGAAARKSVEHRFHPAICAWKWKALLRRISRTYAPGA